MKFSAIEKAGRKTAIFKNFEDGINNLSAENSGIKYCENLISENNVLKTRPSINICEGYLQTGVDDQTFPLKITDVVHYINGGKYNLAYYSEENGGNYNKISVFLVNRKDNILNFGYLQLTNYQANLVNTVLRPQSVVFYSGTRTKGCGIYAFASYKTSADETVYGVFEAVGIGINSAWHEIAENERYVPTILINGRGNKYEEAKETYNLEYSEPETPEKRNIITPFVKAYFSIDGVSTTYYLPEQSYDRGPVKCRVYANTVTYSDYEFDSSGSATVSYYGRSFTAHFDQKTGALYFTEGSGTVATALPRSIYCKENNIMLIVAKRGITNPETVLSCNGAVIYNSRAYLYKSIASPNGIYSCKITNPLYFPTNMQTLVGSDAEEIKGAGYQNDKLIVFKSGETFKVNTSTAENEIKFVSPDLGTRFAVDSLSNESISTKVGCINGDTVASCSGQLIWLGSDKKVYTLEATTYGSEKNVFCISEKVGDLIAEKLQNGGNVFAFVRDGFYYLFCNNTVFICDCHITNMGYAVRYGARNMRNVSWYVWKLPDINYISGKNCGEIMITAANYNKNGFLHFKNDEQDIVFDFANNDRETATAEIPVTFETAESYFKSFDNKIIEKIVVYINSGTTDLELKTDNSRVVRHIHGIKGKTQIANIINGGRGTQKLSLRIKCKGNVAIDSIMAIYKAVI